jgi:hypothetical protein
MHTVSFVGTPNRVCKDMLGKEDLGRSQKIHHRLASAFTVSAISHSCRVVLMEAQVPKGMSPTVLSSQFRPA